MQCDFRKLKIYCLKTTRGKFLGTQLTRQNERTYVFEINQTHKWDMKMEEIEDIVTQMLSGK